MWQSLYVLINAYILNITCHHMPKYFQVSVGKYPNKQLQWLGVQNTTDRFLHMTKADNWVLQFLKNERKNSGPHQCCISKPYSNFDLMQLSCISHLLIVFPLKSISKNSPWVLKNLDWDEIISKWIMKHGVTYPVSD